MWATAPAPLTPGSPQTSGTPAATGGAAAPVEAPAAATPPARVEVTAEDSGTFHFTLSRPTVPAGKVILEFVNRGQDEHNLHALEPVAESMVGSLPNTPSNAHLSLTLELHTGSYTLFCSLPTHEEKGMKATLVVN
jgi:plastocyanin